MERRDLKSTATGAGQLPLFAAADGDSPGWSVRVSPRARRLTVRVYPGARVEVSVPRGTRPRAIEEFVARQRRWIEARIEEFRLRDIAGGTLLPPTVLLRAFEEEWQVRHVERRRPGFRVQYPGRIELYGPAAEPQALRRQLRSWLIDEARRRLGIWLARLGREHGLHYERLQMRRQRTRWGSCSKSGTVSLNVCLLFQTAAVVRYLLLHELCHTRHMNHSSRFWSLVERLEPDWRALDRELIAGWRHVPSWVFH